ncbi:MAG TPA: YdcF family protein, partial [Pyrinomonadaceae bacterium]
MNASAVRIRNALRRILSIKGLCVVAIVAAAWVLVAWFAATKLIVREPLDHADVIVVLSGSASYEERTSKAAELYRSGVAGKIILTNDNRQGGWSKTEERNPFFYERARAELIHHSVAPDDIIVLPGPVYGTHDEALVLRGYFDSGLYRSMVVVTSAFHSRRALWTLKRTFADTGVQIGLEPVPPGGQTPGP